MRSQSSKPFPAKGGKRYGNVCPECGVGFVPGKHWIVVAYGVVYHAACVPFGD